MTPMLLACTLFIQQQIDSTKENLSPSLIQLLRARDASLRTLEIPFEARELSPTGELGWIWTGTWLRSGQMQCLRASRSDPLHGNSRTASRKLQILWDGLKQRTYSESLLSGFRSLDIESAYGGSMFVWLPHRFGLMLHKDNWVDYFEAFDNRIDGTETVLGRVCTILAHRQLDKKGRLASVRKLWLDEKDTLLVLKDITYIPENSPLVKVHNRDACITFENTLLTPQYCQTTLAVTRIGAYWIPIDGLLQMPFDPSIPSIRVTMESERIRVNQPPDPSLMTITPEHGTVVTDVEKNSTLVVHDRRPGLSDDDMRFERVLSGFARDAGVAPGDPPKVNQQLLFSSCGQLATYFYLRVNGLKIALAEVQEKSGVALSAEMSIDEISRTCASFGVSVNGVRLVADSHLPEKPFIAYVSKGVQDSTHDSTTSTAIGHYVVARAASNGITFVSLPDCTSATVTLEQFRSFWNGEALVLASDIRSQGVTRRTVPTIVIVSGAGVSLLAIGLLVGWRSFRSHLRLSLPGSLLVLSVLSTFGCEVKRPESIPSSNASPPSKPPLEGNRQGIKATSPVVFDFGTLEEGELVSADFHFQNTGSEDVDYELEGSCGCRDLTPEVGTLKPNDKAKATVRVYTAARAGTVNEVVTLKNRRTSQKLCRFWVVGTIIGYVRVVPSSDIFDIGELRVGDTREFGMSIDTVSAVKDIPVTLRLAVAPKASAVQKEAEWLPTKPPVKIEENYVRRTRGTIRIRGLSVGDVGNNLGIIEAVDVTGKVRGRGFISARGRVVSGCWFEPGLLYLGKVVRGQSYSLEVLIREVDNSGEEATLSYDDRFIKIVTLERIDIGKRRIAIACTAGGEDSRVMRQVITAKDPHGTIASIEVFGHY